MKLFIKKLLNLITHKTLKQKLLLSYFILIIMPLGLISYFSYGEVYRIIEDNTTFSIRQGFEQSSSFLSYKLYNIYELSSVSISNNTFSDIVQKSNDASYSFLEQVQDMYTLKQFLQSMQDGTNVDKVRLYLSDKILYSKEGNNIFSSADIEDTQWCKILSQSNKATLWAPSSYLDNEHNNDVLSLIRVIINKNNYLDKLGFIRFDFSKSSIVDLLNNATTTKNSSTYIQNSLGTIVAESSQKIGYKNKLDSKLVKKLAEGPNHWVRLNLDNKELMVYAKLIGNTDWYLVSVSPLDEIHNSSKTSRNRIIIFVFAIGTVAYFFAYLLSKSITCRLSILSDKMKDIRMGKLITIESKSDSDEIDQLVQEYNFMTKKITDLINDQFIAGQEIKNAELKALQAQINPHFLYNTLDMINWYAWENSANEINYIVDSLAKFYKLSLNKGNEVVSIKDEITHVLCYFQIQNMRFKNALRLELSIEDSLMQYKIIKITLQPLVENSILHGILSKENKSGNISIKGTLVENEIHLYIEDDGIGMSEERLKNILSPSSENSHNSGFGVRNIDQRIKLYYGPEYGLNYSSTKDHGTIVKITIPANTDSPN